MTISLEFAAQDDPELEGSHARLPGFSLWHLSHVKRCGDSALFGHAPGPWADLFCTLRVEGKQMESTQARCSLKVIAIFASLPPDAIEKIEGRCTWKRYAPGESILSYLDKSDDVFFIALGEVRVTIYSSVGKAVSFREIGAGEIFGEFSAIDRGPRSASVEARTNCLVACMPGSTFRELLQTEPGLANALLPRLIKTIRALTTRVYEFSTLAVNNRIQAELLRLANLGSIEGKVARIVPMPTHVEIANRVSTHREAVTRELNRLSRLGIIERRGGTLLVKAVDRLTEMVHAATGE
jgi:CRP/FNR family cyclic AMP-dependent transcriptional regulator